MRRAARAVCAALAFALLAAACAGTGRPTAASLATSLPAPDSGRMLALVGELAATDEARVAGFPGEAAAAELVAARFRELGLETRIEEFPVPAWRDSGSSFGIEGGARLRAEALIFSPSTPPGGLAAPLSEGGYGRARELTSAAGTIALVRRGEIFFRDKVANAAAAGAIGIVVYDPALEELQALAAVADPSGTPRPAPIPAVTIAGSAGLGLAERLARGEPLRATLSAGGVAAKSVSHNVIAKLPAAPGGARKAGKAAKPGSAAPVLLIGAHLDSAATPGAIDNASGVAALVEMARILAEAGRARGGGLGAELWFAAFGAEEIGSLGSRHAVRVWNTSDIRGVLALDCLGQGDRTMVYTMDGRPNAVSAAAEKAAATLGMPARLAASDASDHASFARAGIPAAFLMNEPVDIYHTSADVAQAVGAELLAGTVRMALGCVVELATAP